MPLASRSIVLVAATLTAACGQWSGAPVKSVEPTAIPLGPGAMVTIARTSGQAGAPAVDSWGATVVAAWVEDADGGARRVVKLAVSADAGATFTAPVAVGDDPRSRDPQLASRHLDVGVAAPLPGESSGAPQVWVRTGAAGGDRSLTWYSRDGGRRFTGLAPHQAPPETVFPERWGHVDGEAPAPPQSRRIVAVGTRRSAGIQEVPMPAGAQGDPAVTVDEHGALALLWREPDEAGRTSLVVRRAWVDWNATGGAAPGFDAAYTLATIGGDAPPPAIATVPGGVIASWIDRGDDGTPRVFARRLGMDMTCTRESAAATR